MHATEINRFDFFHRANQSQSAAQQQWQWQRQWHRWLQRSWDKGIVCKFPNASSKWWKKSNGTGIAKRNPSLSVCSVCLIVKCRVHTHGTRVFRWIWLCAGPIGVDGGKVRYSQRSRREKMEKRQRNTVTTHRQRIQPSANNTQSQTQMYQWYRKINSNSIPGLIVFLVGEGTTNALLLLFLRMWPTHAHTLDEWINRYEFIVNDAYLLPSVVQTNINSCVGYLSIV